MTAKNTKLSDQAYHFILQNRTAALATVAKSGNPHVAIVYCAVHKDLSLFFSTRVEGRKYINLTNYRTVAMTFYNEKHMVTIQLTGNAERVDNIHTEQEVLYELMTFRNNGPQWPPPSMKLFEGGATNELAIIKVTPTEMTYARFETTKIRRYVPFFQRVI